VIRVGVLTPHAAIGPEAEFAEMAPGRVVTCVARVSAGGRTGQPSTSELRALTASPLDEAAARLDGSSVDAIGYASTTSAYAIGFEAEEALVSRLAERLGTPVASTCAATVLVLRVLGTERVALVHPPWFGTAENELGTAYFQSQGFDVVSAASADLPDDPRRISAADVLTWTARAVSGDTEAVFIGGNGFRAAGAVAALEAELGVPVLTANQVLFWNLLVEAGAPFEVSGYGRLFAYARQPAGR
jgi:maleate isomerase